MTTESPLVNLIANDKNFLALQSSILKEAGWTVLVYQSTDEFIQSFNWKRHGCAISLVEKYNFDPWRLSLTLKDRGFVYPVIYISANASIYMAVDAMKNGASNFLSHTAPKERLHEVVKKAIEENKLQMAKQSYVKKMRDQIKQLTKTEKLVLESFCQAGSRREVAELLGMAEKTVGHHCLQINKKLKTQNIVQAVRLLLLSK